MKIEKSGFYNLKTFEELNIGPNLEVVIFDEAREKNKQINIGENAKLKYVSILENGEFFVTFNQNFSNSTLKANFLLLAGEEEKTKAKILSKIKSDRSSSEVFINSFAKGEIDLDGVIDIGKNFKKMSANLVEENIFLGEKAKIKGIPTLLVASNDVKANHACKIEKISEDDLFYLKSRGIDKNNATYILLESKVKNILEFVEKEDVYEGLVEKVLSHII